MYLAGVECALDASYDRVGDFLARNDLNALELRRQNDNAGAVCLWMMIQKKTRNNWISRTNNTIHDKNPRSRTVK